VACPLYPREQTTSGFPLRSGSRKVDVCLFREAITSIADRQVIPQRRRRFPRDADESHAADRATAAQVDRRSIALQTLQTINQQITGRQDMLAQCIASSLYIT
jgi:hypothetical protein